ncbi:MAG TPA: translation initiation factor IF-2 [Clostridia bacterium]|jgi:translation initiation factor IF-2|nr:translation initiation factor IF-2 [Clostridia bacterium]
MATIRVYELAKDMNIPSKELLQKLQFLGLDLKNHMSTIPSSEAERIKKMVLNLDKTMNNKGKEPDQKEQTKAPSEKKAASAKAKTAKTTKDPQPEKKGTADRKEKEKASPKTGAKSKTEPPARPKTVHQTTHKSGKPTGTGAKKSPKLQTPQDDDNSLLTKIERVVGEQAYERGGKQKTGVKKGGRFEERKGAGKKSNKFEKNKRRAYAPKEQPAPVVVKQITLEGPLTVQEFAHLLNKKSAELIKKLISLGVFATINQELDVDTLVLLGNEFGTNVEVKVSKEEKLFAEEKADRPEELQERPPVVTIMGHVDHGKTSLLDTIRHTNVSASEAGGITQHIGAYQVEVKGKKISFLDTPGHEAFTAMRARGAKVTDIAVLVVAADDGVMPQTVEAIHHAQAAEVPIIVAINKVDKEAANPDRIKQELTEYNLIPEEWGGDTICCNVSAKTKEGLENLLETILLVAEMSELKANPNRNATGTVIEAKLDKGRGPVATVLVMNGTLKIGDYLIVGTTHGRVRAMLDDKGRRVKKALPSTPVEIVGLSDVPMAGDIFHVVENEHLAKQIISERTITKREETMKATSRVTLDELFAQIQKGEIQDLNIIIKADVQGSIEAIKQSLEKLSNDEVRVNIIHQGVGGITETDVMLASASNAIIIGFNVRPDANARKAAELQQIDIRLYRVIYTAIEDIKSALSGMLKPELKEVVIGRGEVRAVIKVPKVGFVAGCYISEGKVTRNSQIRVIRDSIVIHEGDILALRRFKDDVKEVSSGFECGISLERFNDFREGDQIEAFIQEEIKRELS